MVDWLVAGNPKKYDVIGAFKELHTIDWRQSTNVQVGDFVYIYVSSPIQSLKFKCVANKVDLTEASIDDKKYHLSKEAYHA
ncbi:MAG: hypothetical protein IKW92_05450 [Firmicutes bacterium]|nr:hypothetical protein [Bacillota bacterium]